MKSVIHGILVAFSLYSAIPVPQVPWEKHTMRWALSFLPLVGLVIGATQYGFYFICSAWNASPIFYAIFSALIPLFISGGIHMDGFCDTCDAICSFGSQEKKLEILKDPHVGAFGPMWMTAFFLAQIACFAQLYQTPKLLALALVGFSVARAIGASKIVSMPCAKNSGLAHLFSENSDKKFVFCTLIIQAILYIFLAAMALYSVPYGIFTASILFCILLLWYWVHHTLCIRIFGGITGDLAGFCICITELICLFVPAIGGMMV